MNHTTVLERAAVEGSYVSDTVSWAQLDRGAFDISYKVVDAAPVRVALRTYNLAFQVEASIEAAKSVVAVVADPQTRARWFGDRFDIDAIATSRDTIDVRTDGPSAFFSITLDEGELQRAYPRSADGENLIGNVTHSKLAKGGVEADRVRRLARKVLMQNEVAPRLAGGTVVALLASALENFSGHAVERTRCLNRRFRAVRACESYMHDHIDATVTLLHLSEIAGMRSRSLINAFEAVTGLSPMDYLKRLRLNGVHRALSHAGKSHTRIIDVATAWGFWHMGHFATDYRAMFGEAPSATLLNARRPVRAMAEA